MQSRRIEPQFNLDIPLSRFDRAFHLISYTSLDGEQALGPRQAHRLLWLTSYKTYICVLFPILELVATCPAPQQTIRPTWGARTVPCLGAN